MSGRRVPKKEAPGVVFEEKPSKTGLFCYTCRINVGWCPVFDSFCFEMFVSFNMYLLMAVEHPDGVEFLKKGQ